MPTPRQELGRLTVARYVKEGSFRPVSFGEVNRHIHAACKPHHYSGVDVIGFLTLAGYKRVKKGHYELKVNPPNKEQCRFIVQTVIPCADGVFETFGVNTFESGLGKAVLKVLAFGQTVTVRRVE